jgi:hypothetical protein
LSSLKIVYISKKLRSRIIKKVSDYDLIGDSFSDIFVSDRTFQYLQNDAFVRMKNILKDHIIQKDEEQI